MNYFIMSTYLICSSNTGTAVHYLKTGKATGDRVSKRVGPDNGGGGSDGGSGGDSRGSSISHRGGNSSNNRLGRSREDSTTSGTMGSTGSSHGGGLLGHYSAENILQSVKVNLRAIESWRFISSLIIYIYICH